MRARLRLVLPILFAIAALAPACIIGGSNRRAQRPGELDYKLGPFTYMEEGKLVSLAVGTEATKERENEKFIPLHLAFANRGAPTLTLLRESFTLQDENGKRYPLASLRELGDTYGPTSMDRHFTTTFDMFRSRLDVFTRVDSNFFPERASGGIVIDRVEVPRFYYLLDLLYFPHPDDQVVGRRFELHVKPTGTADEFFVKFLVG
jgi:hypothetical protein